MYKSIRIQNFRGIKDLEIHDLGRVNLIVGANNVGKSSVLEALSLLHMHRDGYEIGLMLESRGYKRGQSFSGAFSRMFRDRSSDDASFIVEGRKSSPGDQIARAIGRQATIQTYEDSSYETNYLITTPPPPGQQFSDESLCLYHQSVPTVQPYPVAGAQVQISIFSDRERLVPRNFSVGPFGGLATLPSSAHLSSNDLADLLSNMQGKPQEREMRSNLNAFDEHIERLDVAFDALRQLGYVKVIFSDLSDALPLGSLGDGTRRFAEIMTLLPLASEGLALIDEIDSGVYHQKLPMLWRAVDQLSSNNNVQIFATTHSWECVAAAVQAMRISAVDFRLFRIDRIGNELEIVDYDYDLALAATSGRVEVR